MKSKLFLTVLVLLINTLILNAQNYKADITKSDLYWKAEKIVGYHEGNISLKAGSLKIEKDKIISGSFTIDMNTIVCTDLKDKEYNDKLTGHLKSSDFFDVAKFNTATFTINKPVDISKAVTEIKGTLTIKGISKALNFKSNVIKEGNNYIFNANSIIVDRTIYDIRYGSGSFFSNLGDKAIYDEFNIKLKLSVSPSLN
ncbi:MAG: YceI family protein [Bacteroidales bacterium]|nr:YceI family protein [Bacteroidales bacterium]